MTAREVPIRPLEAWRRECASAIAHNIFGRTFELRITETW
jgi:hypothetical protein